VRFALALHGSGTGRDAGLGEAEAGVRKGMDRVRYSMLLLFALHRIELF